MTLDTLFDTAVDRKASDIHLASGESPRIRVGGELIQIDEARLDRSSLTALLEPVLNSENRARIMAGQAVDFTVVHRNLGFVGFAFPCGDDDLAATFRLLASEVPSLAVIGVGGMALFDRLLQARRGLIIMAGPTGSGKWTAASSLLDGINERRPDRIFCIEDRTSYRFKSKKGLVTQLQVGASYESYERALDILNHADLDVVAIDSIPTAEALRKLLVLAETGHLVIANVHADTVPDVLQRVIDAAGRDAEFLRRSLAQNLIAISVQRLVAGQGDRGRLAAYEWVVNTPSVREALASGSPNRLGELQNTDPECRSLDAALDALVADGSVSPESANAVRPVSR